MSGAGGEHRLEGLGPGPSPSLPELGQQPTKPDHRPTWLVLVKFEPSVLIASRKDAAAASGILE